MACGYEELWHMLTVIIIIALGCTCGMLLEPDKNFSYPYNYASAVMGWTYFCAWSFSFYPQIYHNFMRKTTSGLSVDFLLFNVIGFLCYSTFTVSMYYIPQFRWDYERRHDGDMVQVSISDVCFSVHALVLTIVTWAQTMYYDGHKQIPSPWAFLSCFFFMVICAAYILFITQGVLGGRDPFNWYTFIYVIAMVKIVVTIVKYPPQIMTNYRLRSTLGFNILQILLDLLGSILSLSQLVMDCYYSSSSRLEGDSCLWGNPVKLCLSVIVLFYDGILLYQHYIQYPSNEIHEGPSPSSDQYASYSYGRGRRDSHEADEDDEDSPPRTYYTTIKNTLTPNSLMLNHMSSPTHSGDRADKGGANWNSNRKKNSSSSAASSAPVAGNSQQDGKTIASTILNNSYSKYNYTLPRFLSANQSSNDTQKRSFELLNGGFDEQLSNMTTNTNTNRSNRNGFLEHSQYDGYDSHHGKYNDSSRGSMEGSVLNVMYTHQDKPTVGYGRLGGDDDGDEGDV